MRRLGKLEVSEMGAGCMSISANYGPPAERGQGIKVIRTAYERGVTFFDTAEVYGPYTNEDLVGEALAPFRDKVVIATKFGFDIEAGGLNSRPSTSRRWWRHRSGASGRTASISTTSTGSTRRCRIEDTAGAVKDLIRQGKVLHFGLSEASARTIRRAHAVQLVAAVQTEYSLMTRDPEQNGVLQTCEELANRIRPLGSHGNGTDREDR